MDSIISQSSSRVLSQSRLSSRTDQRRDEKRGVKSTKGQRNRKFELEAKIEDSQIAQNLDRTTSPNSIQFLDYFSTSKVSAQAVNSSGLNIARDKVLTDLVLYL